MTAKYHGIKLEYWEHWHNVCELLSHLKSKLNIWRGPYGSQESVLCLLQDWDVSHIAILNIQMIHLRKKKPNNNNIKCLSKAGITTSLQNNFSVHWYMSYKHMLWICTGTMNNILLQRILSVGVLMMLMESIVFKLQSKISHSYLSKLQSGDW